MDEELEKAFRHWWFRMGFEGMVGEPDPTDLPDLHEVLGDYGFVIVRRTDPPA